LLLKCGCRNLKERRERYELRGRYLILFGFVSSLLLLAFSAFNTIPSRKGNSETLSKDGETVTASRGNLKLSMSIDADEYKTGQQMNVSLKLSNEEESKVELEFSTSQVFDFRIIDGVGKEVYVWSSGRFFLQVIRRIPLKADQTFEEKLTYVINLQPGNYAIIGMTVNFLTEAGQSVILETTPVLFTVSL